MTKEGFSHERRNRTVALVAIALFPFALTALFAGLKILRAIDWTWPQVLIPIWIALAGVLPIALLIKLVLKFVVRTGSKIP